MKKFLAHKWHYLSIVVIFGLFIVTVQIRQEKLSYPHSITHEWITSHTLLTLDIWEQAGGPQAYGFKPVYTYDGKGNRRIGNLGGVMDEEDGKLYYTSYPPFAFIFAYYATQLLGGPDIATIRALGLMIHLFCAILIYLIIFKLRKSQKDTISIAGLSAAALYLFSTGTLWAHSILYFSDILIQPLIMLAIYYSIRLFKVDYKIGWRFLLAFGAVIFFGVYTEWLALFFAFFIGLAFLIYYLIQKKKIFLRAFFVVGFSSALAIGITVAQYASINGWEDLVEVSSNKYKERSGNLENVEGMEIYNWENPKSLDLMEGFLNRNFTMVINMIGICGFFLIPILIWRKSRNNVSGLKFKLIIFATLFLAVLIHKIIFYNFNAVHNFANLKLGFLMIFTIGIVFSIVEESINWKMNLVLGAIMLYLLIPRIIRDTRKFHELYSYQDFKQELMISAQLMRKHGDPDKIILGNFDPTPAYIYEARHNLFPIHDTVYCGYFMNFFGCDHAQYYHHEKLMPVYMLELKNEHGRHVVVDRVDFKLQ